MAKELQINELAAASLAYFPFLGIILLLFRQVRNDYYVRYHIIHGILLSFATSIIFLFIITVFSLMMSSDQYQLYLIVISGLGISTAILFLTGYHFFCAYEAYNGKFTVIPGITKIYYLFFEKIK